MPNAKPGERKNNMEICSSCGSSMTMLPDAVVNDCAVCGQRLFGATPPVESIDNMCRECRHPLAPEHDALGCNIPDCPCTFSGAAIEEPRDVLPNALPAAADAKPSEELWNAAPAARAAWLGRAGIPEIGADGDRAAMAWAALPLHARVALENAGEAVSAGDEEKWKDKSDYLPDGGCKKCKWGSPGTGHSSGYHKADCAVLKKERDAYTHFQGAERRNSTPITAPAGFTVIAQYEDEVKAKEHAKLMPGAKVEKNPAGEAWRVLAPEKKNSEPTEDDFTEGRVKCSRCDDKAIGNINGKPVCDKHADAKENASDHAPTGKRDGGFELVTCPKDGLEHRKVLGADGKERCGACDAELTNATRADYNAYMKRLDAAKSAMDGPVAKMRALEDQYGIGPDKRTKRGEDPTSGPADYLQAGREAARLEREYDQLFKNRPADISNAYEMAKCAECGHGDGSHDGLHGKCFDGLDDKNPGRCPCQKFVRSYEKKNDLVPDGDAAMNAFEAHVENCNACSAEYANAAPDPAKLCEEGRRLLAAPAPAENAAEKEWWCLTCGKAVSAQDREPGGAHADHDVQLTEKTNARPGAMQWWNTHADKKKFLREAGKDEALSDHKWEDLPSDVQIALQDALQNDRLPENTNGRACATCGERAENWCGKCEEPVCDACAAKAGSVKGGQAYCPKCGAAENANAHPMDDKAKEEAGAMWDQASDAEKRKITSDLGLGIGIIQFRWAQMPDSAKQKLLTDFFGLENAEKDAKGGDEAGKPGGTVTVVNDGENENADDNIHIEAARALITGGAAGPRAARAAFKQAHPEHADDRVAHFVSSAYRRMGMDPAGLENAEADNANDPHAELAAAARALKAAGKKREDARMELQTRFAGKVTPGDVTAAMAEVWPESDEGLGRENAGAGYSTAGGREAAGAAAYGSAS